MHIAYLVSVWVHVIVATVWLGGMAFLALVVVPVARAPEYTAARSGLIHRAGMRFRTVGWTCLGVLVATGVGNLFLRGLTWDVLSEPRFWTGPLGHTLATKLVLVTAILGLSLWHDFFLGPRASAASASGAGADSADARRLRRTASLVGRINMLLALLVVALAVVFVRGVR